MNDVILRGSLGRTRAQPAVSVSARDRMRAWRERQVAAGRHFVRGRPVDTPRKQRPPGEEPPHGTEARYVWRSSPCRCDDCRRAHAADKREQRAKLAQDPLEQMARAMRRVSRDTA